MPIKLPKVLIIALSLIIFSSALFLAAPFLFGGDFFKTLAGTQGASGWAWAPNIGWIKMSGYAADNSSYGVKLDQSTGQLSGFAWGGDVIGWVDFTGSSIGLISCSSSADCPTGQSCGSNGFCVPSSSSCLSSFECPSGQACINGACSIPSSCSASSDCPAGQVCANGLCAVSVSCSTGADCPSGVCENGLCTATNTEGFNTENSMSLYIVPPSAVVDMGGHTQLQAYYDSGTGAGAMTVTSAPGITWTSSDETIVTVSSGYVMSGNKTGAVDIKVSYSGLTAIVKIAVVDPCAPRLTLSSQLISLSPGVSKQISATYGSTCDGQQSVDITNSSRFSSTYNLIATISDSGLITGVAEGNTQIDVYYTNGSGDNFSASAMVTVSYLSSSDRECKTLTPSFTWSSTPAINETVTFTGAGSGAINLWKWNFTGALPSNPTGKEVNVKFNISGKSTVKLEASDGSNTCTISRTLNIGGRVEE